jgi:hypothetical protein
MHARRSMQKLLAGLGLAAFLIGLAPGTAAALPLPGAKKPFNLFARAISFINVNRVYMGINTIGEVGVDSAGRGTVQGGYWPRGSADNYVFNSGLQVAGVIQGAKSATNPWGGDTTGGWFFDGAGGRQQTEAVTQAYQAFNAADAANWPADAFVPQGDFVADLYAQPLQGLVSASQGDVHFIAWEGNPAFNRNRLHPLGVLVDYRMLAWNYPAGAQDIVFLVATVYNVTSADCSVYAQHRAGIRGILCAQGQKFVQLNDAKFGINLPNGGYTIGPAYMAVAGDNDVGTVGANFNGVILPFAMGYTYDGPFGNNAAGWKFDPALFGPPFFAGVGFVGYKYLKGPDGPGVIQLMTTFCNGSGGECAGHSDPADEGVNFRLLAGAPYPTDGQCNYTSPGVSQSQIHVCFMLKGPTGADTRMAESSAPLSLAPGEAKTVVVAYVYAAPVAIPGFTPVNSVSIPVGDVVWSNSTDSMFKYNQSGSPGLTKVDSISGFLAYTGPHFNSDGSVHVPVQSEFSVVKGSLLGKALVAQAVFDNKFLQEFAPEAPTFFLIPGDKQVTVIWKPSNTETVGDPYFQVVKSPTIVNPAGQTVANALYDPNYRQFDVEGYRVYRGRSDTPSALKLLVQYDYAGTTYKDYTGGVYNGNCAPELGIATDCPATTPSGGFPTAVVPTPSGLSAAVPPGTAYTKYASYNIGPQPSGAPFSFVDITANPRVALLGGTTSLSQVIDTAAVSGGGGFPALNDAGVPFIFVDKAGAVGCTGCGVTNGINYYYSVTAFDVNAPGHGPTSLESAKVTKQVTPQASASNFASTGGLVVAGPNGRAGLLTDTILPTIDTATGEFSKKFPPTNAISVSLAGFVSQVLNGGTVLVQLDSVILNVAGSTGGTAQELATEWMSVVSGSHSTVFSLPVVINSADFADHVVSVTIPGVSVDSALSSIYGGGAGYSIPATVTLHTTDAYITTNWGRGCINSGASGIPQLGGGAGEGRQCAYNGPRWFIGNNETMANPNSDNPDAFDNGTQPATLNNAGALAGVDHIWRPIEYFMVATSYRDVAAAMAPFVSNSDYRMYWGAGGKVDSVIDLTHDVVVPFDTRITASWGILNAAAVPAPQAGTYANRADGALTYTAITCVSNFKTQSVLTGIYGCSSAAPTVALSNTAILGPTLICVPLTAAGGGPSTACNQAVTQAASTVSSSEPGFLLYLKGRIYMMQMQALPAAGTAWTVRDYTGGITGGNGRAGNWGKYAYLPATTRQFSAVGVNYSFSVNASNVISETTADKLALVHTVPDPYYVTSAFDIAVNSKDIQFVNVPTGATIRIYSSSGVLLRVLQNRSTEFGGLVHWDVRNRTNQFVSSGVYFYNVQSGTQSFTGRMTIVNYASTVQ